jgi:SAM-dependent methyltransferase
MASDDDYFGLADIYDDWQEEYGPFWRLCEPRLEAVLRRLPPPQPVALVDLGCGTGSLVLGLRRRHPDWALTGLDASAAMIAAARRKPGADAVTWQHAGFADLRGPHTVAVSFFDALNHAAGPGAFDQAVAAVGRALVPGGLFVFDLNNRLGFEAWWQGRRIYQTERWTLTMDASFDADAGLAHGTATITRPGHPPVSTEVSERAFSEADVRAALEKNGLTVAACEPWRPLTDDVPGKTWWVAVKG